MKDLRRWVCNEKGNLLLFTTVLVVPLMIIFGGLALDLAHLGSVDDEIQRSLDAAALAGAGKLAFDSSVFPAARTSAQSYALANPLHNGGATLAAINLNLNTPNTANGNIVLGIWNGTGFTPSLDGTKVNAVLCRYQTTVPMTFLRLLGFTSLPVNGEAIAWATQPVTPPPTACVFPIGLSSCFFGGPTSAGCGATITFISSSSGSTVGGNSAAWASIVPGQNANDSNINTQVQTAAGGNCSGTPVSTGDTVPVNNGQLNNVMNWLGGNDPNAFPAKYAASAQLVVKKQDGSDAYRGKGWEVYVPVIDTGGACPPGAINGSPPVVGWTRLVITQVLQKNGTCAVANHWTGNPWDSHCFDDKNGTSPHGPSSTVVSGQTGIFGYYDCTYQPAPPSPVPGPITATARLRLVR